MKMASSINSRGKFLRVSFPLLMLVFLITMPSCMAVDSNVTSSSPQAVGTHKTLFAGPPVSFTGIIFEKVSLRQHTGLDEASWDTLENQTQLLDKWFGRPITSATLREDKVTSKLSTSDSSKIPTPLYMNFIHLNPSKTTATASPSSTIVIGRNDNIASGETRQTQTRAATNFKSDPADDFKESDKDTLESSTIDTLGIPPSTHQKSNIQHYHSQGKVGKVSMGHKAQLHEQQHEPGRLFASSQFQETVAIVDEYDAMVPITMYGTGTTAVTFVGHKGHVVNVVLQLRGRHSDTTGLDYNCENTRISAQLRTVSHPKREANRASGSTFSSMITESFESHTFGKLGGMFSRSNYKKKNTNSVGQIRRVKTPSEEVYSFAEDIDDYDENYDDNQNRLWSSFAQLFDTSMLCEVLPSLSLRISKVKEDRRFAFIIQSSVQRLPGRFVDSDSISNQSYACDVEVYISQTPAKELKVKQIIFSVLIPLIVLLVPLPFLLKRADIIQVASLGIDVVDSIWYPPYFLRKLIIAAARRLRGAVEMAWHQRRRRDLQKRLEMQQRALSARMNAAMVAAQSELSRRDPPPTKDAEVPFGLPIRSPPAGTASFVPSLAAPEATAASSQDLPREDEKKGHSVALEPLIRRLDAGERGSRDLSFCPPPAATVVVKTAAHPATEEVARPLQPHREYNETAGGVHPPPPLPASPCKRNTVEGTPDQHATVVVPCAAGGGDERTNHELLFTTHPPCEEDESDAEENKRFCRICRDGEEDGALVAPCNCTGSVRWVHLSCLDHWRIESLKRNMSNVNTCEICKTPFKIKIRRSILIWQSCRKVVLAIILIFTFLVCFTFVPLISYGVFGELSCVAKYHRVPYTTIYKLDGVMLSFFLYIELVLGVILARLIVYSWFRSSPEVEAYIAEVHVVPRFMTWYNVLRIALVTLVLVIQALATGYLIKYFMYITSDIVWNWEASPLLGGIVFIFIVFFAIGISASLREQWVQSRMTRGQAVAADVVVVVTGEGLNPNADPQIGQRPERTVAVLQRADPALPAVPPVRDPASGM